MIWQTDFLLTNIVYSFMLLSYYLDFFRHLLVQHQHQQHQQLQPLLHPPLPLLLQPPLQQGIVNFIKILRTSTIYIETKIGKVFSIHSSNLNAPEEPKYEILELIFYLNFFLCIFQDTTNVVLGVDNQLWVFSRVAWEIKS